MSLIRKIQDRTEGFTAFVPWSYKKDNTLLGRKVTRETTPEDYYRILAFSRMYLDNFNHIQASWFSEGKDVGVKSLSYGADDFGGTLFEENVHAETGHINKTSVEGLRQMIIEGSFLLILSINSGGYLSLWLIFASERSLNTHLIRGLFSHISERFIFQSC